MADITAPLLQRISPADNSTGISVTSNLALIFSEAMKAGSGLIKIYKSDGTLFHSIVANDTTQVKFDLTGMRVAVDPSINLLAGTSYYVIIEPGAFEDLAGNDHAGLSSPTALNFTTAGSGGGSPPADTTAPLLTATTPTDNAANVGVDANLILTFNEAVKAGSGSIEIRKSSDGSLVQSIAVTDAGKVTFSGNQVSVSPSAVLSPGTSYYVVLASGVVRDLANNEFAGISTSAVFNFVTESVYLDTTAPIVLFTTPSDNITGSTSIVITFNEPVVAGTGMIEIRRTSDGYLDRTISVTDGAQVSFSGRNVTINPATDLDPAGTYYVVLAAGVIQDSDGNDYDGSSSVAAFVSATAFPAATGIGSTGYGASAFASIVNSGTLAVSVFSSAFAFASAIGIWQTVGSISVTATASGGHSTSPSDDWIAGNDSGMDLAALSYGAAMNGELTYVSSTRIDILGTDGLTYRFFGSGFVLSASSVAGVGGSGIWLVEVWEGSGGDAHILHSHYNQFGSLSSTGSFDVSSGLAADDMIIGSSDDDALVGFGGNDTIIGREGDDVLNGGDGDDLLSGGPGSDSLTGGAGADTFKFMSGAHLNGDSVSGLESTDKIDLSEMAGLSFIGSAQFSGVAGQVRYVWGGGSTTLQVDSNGNGVSDVSLLLNGAQFVLGETQPGSNILVVTGIVQQGLVLTGNGLSNTLAGGTGNDVITGAGGRDTLTGAGGSDKFVYNAVSESTGMAYDTIADFNASADVLDLWFQVTGVDATIASGSLSPRGFDYALTSAVGAAKLAAHHAVLFTPNAGALSGSTFLIVDANGVAGYQAGADLVILLGAASSLAGLTAADFV